MFCYRALAAILLAIAASSASAQNFVVNGDFDTDSHGWTLNTLSGAWSTNDSIASAVSGSEFFVTNPSWGFYSGSLTQCVSISNAASVDFKFYSLLYFEWSLQAFVDPACTGQSEIAAFGQTSGGALWVLNQIDAIALPASTSSVLVSFELPVNRNKALVDTVSLRPAGQIFESGFEELDQ